MFGLPLRKDKLDSVVGPVLGTIYKVRDTVNTWNSSDEMCICMARGRGNGPDEMLASSQA